MHPTTVITVVTGFAPDLCADPHGNPRLCDAKETLDYKPNELYLLWVNYCGIY